MAAEYDLKILVTFFNSILFTPRNGAIEIWTIYVATSQRVTKTGDLDALFVYAHSYHTSYNLLYYYF